MSRRQTRVTKDDIAATSRRTDLDVTAAGANLCAGVQAHDAGIEEATRGVLDDEALDPAGSRLRGATEKLERAQALDAAVVPLQAAMSLLDRPPLGGILSGRWLGHSLHPLLTDFPLGMWIGTTVLDVFGGDGSRDAADRLLLGGIVATFPTMASGWRDWTTLGRRAQRVGAVHAASNSAALLFYGASYLQRRRGRRASGVLLSVGGGVLANIAGYLGGHLTLVRGVTADRRPAPTAG